MRHKYTEEDITFLKENYPIGNWEAINTRFPNLSRHAINSKMNKIGVKFDIRYHVHQTDFSKRTNWSDSEIQILIDNYSILPVKDVLRLLPNRTKDGIVHKAVKLGLKSYTKSTEVWTDEEKQYLIDNWDSISDELLAKQIGKTQRAVRYHRTKLGLFRINIDHPSYATLSKYLRGQNFKWKEDSMLACDYKCVLTGSKNFQIHHQYGVSNIISDIFKERSDLIFKDSLSDYSDDELDKILKCFLEIQSRYPLGECVDVNLHKLFHSLYGQYYNTPEQWEQFKIDYRNGEYN